MKRNKENTYRLKIIQEFHLNKSSQRKLYGWVKASNVTYGEYYEFCHSHIFPQVVTTFKLMSTFVKGIKDIILKTTLLKDR